jgi:small subunit ribosomal protein S8
MMTDPIADMLNRIRNAQKARHATVEITASKVKHRIAEILLTTGYISDIKDVEGMPAKIVLTLKYVGGKPAIQEVARVSKPGHRKYTKTADMPRILNDYGIAIVSTSSGLMTNKEARQKGIGGEIICSVY